jgi:hypothetical protein
MRNFLFYTVLTILFSTPLSAQKKESWKTGDFFIYINTDESVLSGHTDLIMINIESYLSEGVSIDAQDANGNTALHIAVLKSNPQLVLALLQFSPNSKILNQDGKTPLALAKERLVKNRDNDFWNDFWQETVDVLEQYEKVLSIKYAITFLRKGDASDILEDRIYNMEKFVKNINSLDDVIATDYLFKTSKEALVMQLTVTDRSLLGMVDAVDAKWKDKVNSLLTPELDKIESEIKNSKDEKSFIKAEERLTEINNATYQDMSKENTDKFNDLYSTCSLKLYDMTKHLIMSDLEKRLKLLLQTKVTGDELVESALAQLLEISITMGNTKLLIFINVLALISCDDYKGNYKNVEFIKTLQSINDLFKINKYEPSSVDKIQLEELKNKARRQKFVLNKMSLRLN